MDDLTTTSFGLLGLLALRDWSTYELAKQMGRSLGLVWPRAEPRLYGEAKKLVRFGLVTARQEPTGRRPRTVYRITPAGRGALRDWLEEPGSGLRLEFETMVKIAFGEHGSRAAMLRHLDAVVADSEAKLALGRAVAAEYLSGTGPYPDRLHVSGLAWRFLADSYAATLDWARWARAEVQTWPDMSGPPDGPAAAFARYVADAPPPARGRR